MKIFFLVLFLHLVIPTYVFLLTACGIQASSLEISLKRAGDFDYYVEPCNVKLNSSELAADCGTLMVPENRANPASRLISLPITRIRATGSHPVEPVFHLESILGSPFSQLIWCSAVDANGAIWPTALMPDEFRRVQTSDVETLLVSGNVDFATPAEYTRDKLLPALSNGKQVILSEIGHVNDVVSMQPEAYEKLITTFYETGEVDHAQFEYIPMDFDVERSFPFLAKVALGSIGVLLLAIVAGIGFLIRRSI